MKVRRRVVFYQFDIFYAHYLADCRAMMVTELHGGLFNDDEQFAQNSRAWRPLEPPSALDQPSNIGESQL